MLLLIIVVIFFVTIDVDVKCNVIERKPGGGYVIGECKDNSQCKGRRSCVLNEQI